MDNPDDIRQALVDAGAALEPGDIELARTGVHDKVRRRRRRTRIVSSVAAAALLVGGVLAFVSFDNSDEAATLVGVDPTTTAAAADGAPAETSASTLPEASSVPVQASAGRQGTTVASPTFESYDTGYGAEWVVPWKDGFIVGSTLYAPQSLPATLPDDVVALFPDEVAELFAGGLPPTVAEARTMLMGAGLLEVVTEILANNPNANTAVFSAQQQASVDARFTVDGSTWEPIEVVLPDGLQDEYSVAGVGDRLAILSRSSNAEDGFVVAWTTDLTTWTVQPIELPAPPVGLADLVTRDVRARSLTATRSGWVAGIYETTDLNVEALLPSDVRSPPDGGEYRGYGTTESGVEVFIGVGPGAEVERKLTYTWDELGITPEVLDFVNLSADGGQQVWAASWSGEPARSDLELSFGSPIATESGFLVWTDETWFSSDGVSWAASALPVADGQVTGSMSYGSGVVLLVTEGEASSIYRVDARGQFPELLDPIGLPTASNRTGDPNLNGAVIVLDNGDSAVTRDAVVVTVDGFELTWDFESGLYELRDATTGGLFVSGLFGSEDQFVSLRQDRTDFLDPATGDLLVSFTREVVDDALAQQSGDPSASRTYEPDWWLLATRDGEQFVVDDLDDGYGPVMAAVNGDTMLVLSGGGWIRYNFS